MTKPRTLFLDPDFRPTPKTDHYCYACSKDMKHTGNEKKVFVDEDGMEAVHPEDVAEGEDLRIHNIGPDCAKRLGLTEDWLVCKG